MYILVLSCDKNSDTFEPFHHCIEKYWPNHPEIIYKSETVGNPYYETICTNYPLEKWTSGVRKVLDTVYDSKVLLMVDDCFIRKPVDEDRIKYLCTRLGGNIACFNFEKSFDKNDEETDIEEFKRRQHGSDYELSIMCGLWDKDKLIDVLSGDATPWEAEIRQRTCGYDYYINSGDYIIDWGYRTWHWSGICRGQWCQETVDFLTSEGIDIDWSKRGIR